MIEDVAKGNIFATTLRNIAFAINAGGKNDSGFAGQVLELFTPRFNKTGKRNLGEVITVETEGKIFHGLVCHRFGLNGWEKSPETITACLDKINLAPGDAIAVVLMGSGFLGRLEGADVAANIRAIHRSRNKCIIYSLDIDKKAIMAIVNSLI